VLRLLVAGSLLWPTLVLAAAASPPSTPARGAGSDEPVEQNEKKLNMMASKPRSAVLPAPETLTADMMPAQADADGLDQYQWLEPDAQLGLVVHRASNVVEAQGVVVVLSTNVGSYADSSFAGQLRHRLPDMGWHSALVGLPLRDADQTLISQRLTATLTQVRERYPELPVVLAVLGDVALPTAQLLGVDEQSDAATASTPGTTPATTPALDIAGVALVNMAMPPQANRALSQIEIPALLVQIQPRRFPGNYGRRANLQVRQLPRVSPRQPKSLLVRQLRGWLRQFEASS